MCADEQPGEEGRLKGGAAPAHVTPGGRLALPLGSLLLLVLPPHGPPALSRLAQRRSRSPRSAPTGPVRATPLLVPPPSAAGAVGVLPAGRARAESSGPLRNSFSGKLGASPRSGTHYLSNWSDTTKKRLSTKVLIYCQQELTHSQKEFKKRCLAFKKDRKKQMRRKSFGLLQRNTERRP